MCSVYAVTSSSDSGFLSLKTLQKYFDSAQSPTGSGWSIISQIVFLILKLTLFQTHIHNFSSPIIKYVENDAWLEVCLFMRHNG